MMEAKQLGSKAPALRHYLLSPEAVKAETEKQRTQDRAPARVDV